MPRSTTVLVGLTSLTAAFGLTASLTGNAQASQPATGAAASNSPAARSATVVSDDRYSPLEAKRRELREEALTSVLNGAAKPISRGRSTVVKVADAASAPDAESDEQFAELAREGTDKIFVVLAEFGDQRHPDYPDQDTDPNTPGPQRFDGPPHNEIPEPDRSRDNTTIWQPDYSREHFQRLYFGTGAGVESVKTYYETQSSGRYSVDGTVTDWVTVPYNEARYGRSNGFPCAGSICDNTWELIRDAVTAWIDEQAARGLTDQEIAQELAEFDVWDRYDHDADGNFNEPDGYIDHFQIVHSGGDQADGDPSQGEDAIWSHRWYAFTNDQGETGPEGAPFGGTEIGDTGLWVGDYTIQPENGGLGVFAHEYGHDLGLPDLYDLTGAENGVNWWSLMAQSRVSAADDQGIGTRAADFGAWEKLQQGWLDYEIVEPGQTRRIELGPHEHQSNRAQGVVVVLPKKDVTTELAEPFAGERDWWSDAGPGLNTTLTRQVSLPDGEAELSFQAQWDIEDCGSTACDYAYVEVDDGTGWTPIAGSITNPDEGNGIDGTSDGWQPASFDLSAYASSTIGLRFRYETDGAVDGLGFFADEITLTAGGQTVFADGGETDDHGWTVDGFRAVGASVTESFDNYYIASNRAYLAYDRYLRSGPYNFGFGPDRPRWVEHFPYQNGLLVSYWDTSQHDNNTSLHPGHGEILPVDANPQLRYRPDGQPWRGRIQGYDATFGLENADTLTLHIGGQATRLRGRQAQPLFDDRRKYWSNQLPAYGVQLPGFGAKIRVLKHDGGQMTVQVSWAR